MNMYVAKKVLGRQLTKCDSGTPVYCSRNVCNVNTLED